ncbi:major facilitator superfamily domain-containing protein [Phycomyces nitens]|nr:major facilitator superfamily domain-containing protein [Phycomyces nitens]
MNYNKSLESPDGPSIASQANVPETTESLKSPSIHTQTASLDQSLFGTVSEQNDSISNYPSQEKASQDPSWQLKTLVLMCMLSIPVGCHYLEATVGTLKTSLKHSMNINNTEFSILLSSVTLVNTVLPLLVGNLVDDISFIGSIRSTTIVSTVIFIGSILVSIASSYNNYPMMITGQVIYGLGDGMIVTMQEAILSRWFRDHQLSIIVGVLLSVARLTKWAAKMVSYPIIQATGSKNWPIYIATLFCGLGVVMNIIYWFGLYKYGYCTASGRELKMNNKVHAVHPKSLQEPQYPHNTSIPSNLPRSRHDSRTSSILSQHLNSKTLTWTISLIFYIPGIFWMVPWVQLIMSSVLSSFSDIATEFVQFRFGSTSVTAGYQSSLTQVVPIVGAPLMGVIVHRYGKRLFVLFSGTLVLIIALALLAFTDVTPEVGLIMFSLALALGPIGLLSSTPLLLPHEMIGTGMGLHKSCNNIGTTIVSVLVGYVQDLTYHDGDSKDNMTDLASEYDGVMVLYIVLACCSAVVAIVFWIMDRKFLDSWLQINKKEREERLNRVYDEQDTPTKTSDDVVSAAEASEHKHTSLQRIGSQLLKKKSYVYFGVFLASLFISWVIFFTFALMPVYQKYNVVD